MRDPKKHITYSLTDIEQYLQGKLSPAEMHELEKAALQDPFLADAIEGYEAADLDLSKKDLAEIETRLLEEKLEEPKTILIPSFQNNWWKIAAATLLFAGAGTIGWLVFNNNPGKKEIAQQTVASFKKDTIPQPLARVKEPVQVKSKTVSVGTGRQIESSKSLVNAETLADIDKNKAKELLASENLIDKKRFFEREAMAELAIKPPPSLLRDQAQLYTSGRITVGSLSDTFTARVSNDVSPVANLSSLTLADSTTAGFGGNMRKPMYTFSGSVLHAKTLLPIPNASISLAKTRQQVLTDAAGNFVFKSYDTVLPIHISSVGFEQKDLVVTAFKPTPVKMQESNDALNEVIITGYGKSSKKEVAGNVSSPKPVISDETNLLQGRVAGIDVSQNNAKEKNKPIRIRGLSSSQNNKPLFVVDGIPAYNTKALNPNSIDKIEVLKDSVAALKYGVSNSGSVILVTTSKNRENHSDTKDKKISSETNATIPEGGWASLTDYLKKKINTPDTTTVIQGTVTVELTLKNGKVQHVSVIQTFNALLNKSLIKALMDGPGWISSIAPGKKEKRFVILIL